MVCARCAVFLMFAGAGFTSGEELLRIGSHDRLEKPLWWNQIRRVFNANKGAYGSPRIHRALQNEGLVVSRHRVAKLMKENGIHPKRRKKRVPVTTDSQHAYGIAPNLLERNFEACAPDTIWLADITYVVTDEGWLYLAAIKDMATREIVGWSMDDHLKSSLCENALSMAIMRRDPAPGLVHHSDRGVQYACKRLSAKAGKPEDQGLHEQEGRLL